MDLTIADMRIEISAPSDSQSAYIGLVIGGSLLLAGSVTMGVLAFLTVIPSDLLPLGVAMLLFGLLFVLTGRSRLRQTFSTGLEIDGHLRRVTFSHKRVREDMTIPFSEIQEVSARARTERSHTAGETTTTVTRKVWPVVLELVDGSSFWIVTQNTYEDAVGLVSAACALIGCPGRIDGEQIRDGVSGQEAGRAGVDPGFAGSHSALLRKETLDSGTAYTIGRTYTGSDLIVLLIVAILMSAVALAASGLLTGAGISGSGFRPLGAVVGLVPLGIISYLVFLIARRYRIVLGNDGILVELHFRPGYRNPSRTITLPASSLRSVRVDRLEMGAFRLSVGVDYAVKIQPMSAFLSNVGAFRKNMVSDDRGEQVVRLFEIAPWGTPPFGADFRDLRYLERHIEQFYRLRERE